MVCWAQRERAAAEGCQVLVHRAWSCSSSPTNAGRNLPVPGLTPRDPAPCPVRHRPSHNACPTDSGVSRAGATDAAPRVPAVSTASQSTTAFSASRLDAPAPDARTSSYTRICWSALVPRATIVRAISTSAAQPSASASSATWVRTAPRLSGNGTARSSCSWMSSARIRRLAPARGSPL